MATLGQERFRLSEEQCEEADREFVQFYQRRLCWLALREFSRAVADADHTLTFMDFARDYSPSEDWTEAHEQYRPFVLFQRTQAAALGALEEHGPDRAVEEINRGLERMRDIYESSDQDEPFEEDELVTRLIELRESLRSPPSNTSSPRVCGTRSPSASIPKRSNA